MAEHRYPITITPELVVQWEQQAETLQKRIESDTANLRLLRQKLEALSLFVTNENTEETTSRAPAKKEEIPIRELSPRDCVRYFLRTLQTTPTKPISLEALRNAITRSEYPKEKFGRNFSYFYTILGRMQESAEIVRDDDKIWYAGK